jgi:hypothetical protein
VRTLALLGLVLGLLAITAVTSPWVVLALRALGFAFHFSRVYSDIRRTPAWLVGPGWPPLVGGAGGLVALAVTAILLLAVLSRRSRLPAPDLAPTLAR